MNHALSITGLFRIPILRVLLRPPYCSAIRWADHASVFDAKPERQRNSAPRNHSGRLANARGLLAQKLWSASQM